MNSIRTALAANENEAIARARLILNNSVTADKVLMVVEGKSDEDFYKRIKYQDQQNTVWLADLYLNPKDADAETLADMILKRRMAKDGKTALNFISELHDKFESAFIREGDSLKNFAVSRGYLKDGDSLNPWDSPWKDQGTLGAGICRPGLPRSFARVLPAPPWRGAFPPHGAFSAFLTRGGKFPPLLSYRYAIQSRSSVHPRPSTWTKPATCLTRQQKHPSQEPGGRMRQRPGLLSAGIWPLRNFSTVPVCASPRRFP